MTSETRREQVRENRPAPLATPPLHPTPGVTTRIVDMVAKRFILLPA